MGEGGLKWRQEHLRLSEDSSSSFILAFPPEAQAAEWRRVLNIRELFKSQLLAPQKQSVASADSMEKMNLGSMDFPESHVRCSRGEGEVRNGSSNACDGVFPSLPVQKLH